MEEAHQRSVQVGLGVHDVLGLVHILVGGRREVRMVPWRIEMAGDELAVVANPWIVDSEDGKVAVSGGVYQFLVACPNVDFQPDLVVCQVLGIQWLFSWQILLRKLRRVGVLVWLGGSRTQVLLDLGKAAYMGENYRGNLPFEKDDSSPRDLSEETYREEH